MGPPCPLVWVLICALVNGRNHACTLSCMHAHQLQGRVQLHYPAPPVCVPAPGPAAVQLPLLQAARQCAFPERSSFTTKQVRGGSGRRGDTTTSSTKANACPCRPPAQQVERRGILEGFLYKQIVFACLKAAQRRKADVVRCAKVLFASSWERAGTDRYSRPSQKQA